MRAILYSAAAVLSAMVLLPSLAFTLSRAPEDTEDRGGESNFPEQKEITVINGEEAYHMELEDYITGVVLAEMPASYFEEALKAQAVAARTYAVNKSRSSVHDGNAVCTNYACCQAYISPDDYEGGKENLAKVKKAVYDTAGEIMLYDSEPISAVFHSMSAGRTASAEDVWGRSVPYLTSVESPLEASEEGFETTAAFPIGEFIEKLKTLSSDYDGGLTVPPPERDSSGYVKTIQIGSAVFSGSDIRNLFSLRSTNFNLGFDTGNAVFTVRGYGHGVGMSQHGANLLAENGADYKEILSTYYTGVSLSHI